MSEGDRTAMPASASKPAPGAPLGSGSSRSASLDQIRPTLFSPLQQVLVTWLLVLLVGSASLAALAAVGEVVSLLVTASLVAFLLNYPVARLQRLLSRGVAAALVYGVAAVGTVAIATLILPPVASQARQLALNLPDLLESGRVQLEQFQAWGAGYGLPLDVQWLEQQLLDKLQSQSQALASRGLVLVADTLRWAIDAILIVVLSFYLLVDGDRVWRSTTQWFVPVVRDRLTASLRRNLQQFIAGQVLLGTFMAVTLAPLFFWLKVPFFLLFAVFIGVLEAVPLIGATLGIATVSAIVAFLDWWLALQVLAVAVIVQQIKDNVIAPRILGNLTGLSPAIVLAALLLGVKVAGILGAILAIPVTGVLKSLVEIAIDPTLPPQTGSFFVNPLQASPAVAIAPEQRSPHHADPDPAEPIPPSQA